jgi:phosphate transport system ATP-binding protein
VDIDKKNKMIWTDPLTRPNVRVSDTAQNIATLHDVEEVLKTEKLTIGFNEKTVLSNISISFEKATITALVGPSGSGKSTYLRTLNRLNDEIRGFWHEGGVVLDDVDIYGGGLDPLYLRRRVGMVFQRPNPFPMSIKDNVLIGVKAHKLAEKSEYNAIAKKYLETVGLWQAVSDRLDDSPFKLSGGQQQLLCLARALAVQPEVILLDEPTSSLDPLSTKAVEELLKKLVSEITVVIITHNLAQARRIADKAAFFWDGELVEMGSAAQVLEEPENETTRKFVTGQLG